MGMIEITTDKIYNFSNMIKKVWYMEQLLIIDPIGCKWLVLEKKQEPVFDALNSGNTIEMVLERFEEETVVETVLQIEAKQFGDGICKFDQGLNLFIYLTNRCNLKCRHCYMYSGDKLTDELPVEEWIRVLKEFKDIGGEGVTFSGGEVALYEGFIEIIKACNKLGLLVTVLTNGTLWDKKTIAEIAELVDEIQISLDGYNDDSYSSVRGARLYNSVIATIEQFAQTNIRVSVAVTPLYDNLDDFIKEFKFVALELIKKHANVFIKVNLELISGRDIEVCKSENAKYKKKLKKMVNDIYPNYYIENFAINYDGHMGMNNCGYGGITLASDGSVYWCNRIFEMKSEVSVLRMNLREVYEMSKQVKKKMHVDNIRPCNNCEIKYICGGGCRLKYKEVFDKENKIQYIAECDKLYKASFYEKMILSNEYFFVE